MTHIENNPLVSILIPCYNHEQFIEECVESAVNQTYESTEIIVIDDGSTDNSPAILDNLSKKYGFCFIHQENMGISATLNKMIKMAKGEYVSLLGSDDIFTPDKIQKMMGFILDLDESYCMVCGNATFIDENSQPTCINNSNIPTLMEYCSSLRTDDIFGNFGSYESLLINNYIPPMSAIIRKKCIMDDGLFNINLRIEDWDFCLRLAHKYKMKYIPEITAYYRIHGNNFSLSKSNVLKILEDSVKILLSEKKYAFQNNYYRRIWKEEFTRKLLSILKSGYILLFFYYVIKINILSFFYYSVIVIMEKFKKQRSIMSSNIP